MKVVYLEPRVDARSWFGVGVTFREDAKGQVVIDIKGMKAPVVKSHSPLTATPWPSSRH